MLYALIVVIAEWEARTTVPRRGLRGLRPIANASKPSPRIG